MAIVWAGGYSLQPRYSNQWHCKKVIRIISGLNYQAETTNLSPKLNIFDLYKYQLATFMYLHHRNSLPHIFNNYFITIYASMHKYQTRSCLNIHIELQQVKLMLDIFRVGWLVLDYGMLLTLLLVLLSLYILSKGLIKINRPT